MDSHDVVSLLSFITPIDSALRRKLTDTSEHPYLDRDDIFEFSKSPLSILLDTLVYLPYAVRKFLLTFSRIQQSINANQHLQQDLQSLRSLSQSTFYLPSDLRRILYANIGKVSNSALVSVDDLLPLLENIYDDPIGLSILCYFTKAETTIFPDEFRTVGDETIDKEIRAALLPNVPQALDYRGIFTEDKIPMHIEQGIFSERTAHLWKTQLHRLASMYTDNSTIFFPHYNGKKNVSYSTQTQLASFLNDGQPILEQPTQGCIPYSGSYFSSSFHDDTFVSEVSWWVPPCEDDSVFCTPWLEILFSTFRGIECNLPVEVGSSIPLPRVIYPGGTFAVTMDKLSSVLVDLSHAKKELQIMRTPFDEALLQRVEKAFSGQLTEHSLYMITIDSVPSWYTDVHDVLYPIPFSSGPFGQDAVDEISTIWEGSFDTSDDDMSL